MTVLQNGSTNGSKDLPDGTSSSLRLIPSPPEQAPRCWALNAQEWSGPLSEEAYFRREQHLASQPLTKKGGTTYWILVDSNDNTSEPTILSSCESYRKKALVARKDRPGHVEEVISHGIGSVFCRDDFRGKGYAGRMMQELAEHLKTWQQSASKEALFNVLYSDIGKKFYAKRGWIPFPSSHISLPAIPSTAESSVAETTPLYAADLPALCEADVSQLKRSMSKFSDTDAKVKVAFVPEYDLIQWQHSREEFVSQEVFKRDPAVKGVLVGSEVGKRVWCIWTRVFDKNHAESTFYITRLVIEDSDDFVVGTHSDSSNETSGTGTNQGIVDAIAACLKAAQIEAAKWQIGHVQIWNPAVGTLQAARKIQPDVKLVEREGESITSLLWYGSEVTPDELEWVGNEKYGWC